MPDNSRRAPQPRPPTSTFDAFLTIALMLAIVVLVLGALLAGLAVMVFTVRCAWEAGA